MVKHGLPQDLARQYAQQAVDNAGQGLVVGSLAKVMTKLKSLGMGKPDTPKSGSGTSKPTR